MKKFLEVTGWLLLLQGVGGLLHTWTGWFERWALVYRVGLLEGHEIFASIVLAVAGAAVLIASDRVASVLGAPERGGGTSSGRGPTPPGGAREDQDGAQ
ncbi:hypothetical protein [Streptomyces sp. ASQP_92]|uniref:hypothetical protein n=1 Tax=Streptomyces sp. ASQP_92 TaxID=2979116 RepID=UPI0028F6D99C|nr:hypothetical protein [Streptomyces sp. ASQP_92]